jgi:calcineurin-like phosphoesterase family protein
MKFEKKNIFFISDLHTFHKNIIQFDDRPFKDLDEMHFELIKRWNDVVSDDDIVFHLGDLSFGRSESAKWFVHSLNGKIHHIMGNHDRMKDIIKLDRFEAVYEYGTEIWIKDEDIDARGSGGYQHIIMSHYPILSWNRAHYGSFHLHGHCHGSLIKEMPKYYERKVMDVGANCIDYTPISYFDIKNVMNKKKIDSFDHH